MTSYGERLAKAIRDTLHGSELPFLITPDVPGWKDFITFTHGNGVAVHACYYVRDRRRAVTTEEVVDICDEISFALEDRVLYRQQSIASLEPYRGPERDRRQIELDKATQALADWREAAARLHSIADDLTTIQGDTTC